MLSLFRYRCFKLGCLSLLVTLLPCVADVRADDVAANGASETNNNSNAGRKAETSKVVEPDVEKKTLKFVSEYEPKLKDLLVFLREKQPRLYQQAMREMTRAEQRLSQLKGRDEELFELELKLWQSRSRQRLLAAEIASGKVKDQQPKLKQLEALVQKQAELEIEKLSLLKSRAAKQVAKLEKQIDERREGQTAFVQRLMKTWENQINKKTTSKKAQRKNVQ